MSNINSAAPRRTRAVALTRAEFREARYRALALAALPAAAILLAAALTLSGLLVA
jgi:hypothetical protein